MRTRRIVLALESAAPARPPDQPYPRARSRARCTAALLAALVAVAAGPTPGRGAAAPTEDNLPRTAWGDPDLQGIWSNATLTPLERPDTVKTEYLTEEQAAETDSDGMARTLAPIKFEVDASGELNEAYMELGQVVRSRRTSLITDPADGKLPLTPEGVKLRTRTFQQLLNLLPIDSYRDRPVAERCLLTGGLHVPNPFYLNNHQIFQTPDTVAIRTESMNETRIIPLDRRDPLDPHIRLWAGASRGHWEGDTLVVETANFNGQPRMIGSSDQLRLVERFTRVDADTIDYEVTVTDPVVYTRPWTYANTLRAIEGPIYEYACHEGNYGIVNVLAGARAQDAAKVQEP